MKNVLKHSRILIVDDQVANIDMLEGFLEMEGYENFTSTNDSRKVMPMIESYRPDLLLLDLMMPHLSGFDIMEKILPSQSKENFIPILVLTADITQEAKRKALSLGASDFVTKPFDLGEVGLRINNLLFTRYLMVQLQGQNLRLEEKVRERTAELERANKELIQARDKALAGDRLKTMFMQNISHEIRTPLNGILGFSTLIAESDYSDCNRPEYISHLHSSCNRLVNTVNNYMDISLLASGNMMMWPKTVRLNSIMEEVKRDYRLGPAPGAQHVSLNIDEKLDSFSFRTDPEFLRKILTHLIDNALKYAPGMPVTVDYRLEGDTLEFSVGDKGPGIPEKAVERIFEGFVQEESGNSRTREGSGLGLTIVNGLLDLLGGGIRIETAEGKGSVFIFTLPVSEQAPAATAEEHP